MLGSGAGNDRAVAAGYWGEGYRICRPFKVVYGPMYVSAHGIRCRKATRILKEWWKGPDSRQTFVDDSTGGHVLLDRYPGWVCSDGASAGGCHKGNRHAAYNFFEPRALASLGWERERASRVAGCPNFQSAGLTFREIQRHRQIRCRASRRLLLGAHSVCGHRETWHFHAADGLRTCWFRRGDAVLTCKPFLISNFHDEYGPHPFRAWDVRRSSDLRCSMARKLLKAAYRAGPLKIIRKVYEGGGSGRPTYWLKNGWRCGNGAGGASCFNEYKLGFNDIEYEGISLAVTASTG